MPARHVPICSKCGFKNDRPSQRYCWACHAEYMREWRKTHRMNEGQRRRDSARSVAGFVKRRGKLSPQPCQACGDSQTEMHHPDHEQPLVVVWMCRPCHLAWHSFSREMLVAAFSHWLGKLKPVADDQTRVA